MFQKIVKASIYLLVFLVPLFWLPFSFEALEFNKIYLIFFLTSIGFLAWLAKMIFEDKKIRFRRGPLDIFVLVFLVVMVLSAVFSVDKVSSFYGFYGRFWPNLIGLFSLVVFYFLLTNNIAVEIKGQESLEKDKKPKTKDQIGKPDKKPITINGILKTFLWSSFFVVLFSYFSLFGILANISKSLGLSGIISFRTFNTIGGSFEQLAMFLALVFVLLTAILAFRTEEKKAFLLYIFLFAIFLLLVFIDFWASFLVIFLSLILFIGFAFWKRIFREDVNRLSFAILFVIISAVFLFTSPLKNTFQQSEFFGGLPEELRLSQGMSWSIGFEGLKDNLIFGSGEGTFSYLFSKYKPQSFLETPFWQLRFDRAGNHISEVLGTTGILGILSYFALIGMFLMISFLGLKTGSWASGLRVQFPLILAFLAILTAQFVFYQNTTLAFSFWLFLALNSVSWQKLQREKVFKFGDFPEAGLIMSILFWVILLGLGLLYFTMLKFYLADVNYRNYLLNPLENLPKMEKAVRLNDSSATYHIELARGYLLMISEELAKPQPDNQLLINLVALSIQEGRRATEVAPKRIAAQETLGVVYREIQWLAQGALEWGIKTFRTAIEEEPRNPILLTELGKLLIIDNETDEAKTLFNRALELRKDYVGAGVQLALLAEGDGNIEEAIERIEALVRENPFSVEAHFQLGRLYYNKKEYDKAVGQFQSVLTIFPNHSNSLYSLGLIYELRGETGKALEMFRKVLEINPGNENIKEKIKSLGAKPEPETETEAETEAEAESETETETEPEAEE